MFSSASVQFLPFPIRCASFESPTFNTTAVRWVYAVVCPRLLAWWLFHTVACLRVSQSIVWTGKIIALTNIRGSLKFCCSSKKQIYAWLSSLHSKRQWATFGLTMRNVFMNVSVHTWRTETLLHEDSTHNLVSESYFLVKMVMCESFFCAGAT